MPLREKVPTYRHRNMGLVVTWLCLFVMIAHAIIVQFYVLCCRNEKYILIRKPLKKIVGIPVGIPVNLHT